MPEQVIKIFLKIVTAIDALVLSENDSVLLNSCRNSGRNSIIYRYFNREFMSSYSFYI